VALGLALRELQNIHPCTYVQGVLWYGVNAKNRLREKNVVKTGLTAFGQMIIAYTLAATTVLAAFTAMFGFNATLWGSAILFSICTLGFLAVWWQEER